MRPRRLHELGEELVGWEATLPGESLPENTLHSVKRVIGRQYADVHDLLGVLPFTFQPGPDDSVVLTYEKSSSGETASRHIHTITPEEVSAKVLSPLLQRAEAACKSPIESAVITIPAHFGPGQKEATIRAGHLAGLKHVELLQEPVAAAMASGLGMDLEDAHTILVFDLGGGTFDISILDSFEGIMEVLATGGDSLLGGDNWDEAMVAWAYQTIAEDSEELDTQRLRHQLRTAARNAKERLSTVTETQLELPENYRSAIPSVTRQQFQDITQPLLERLWTPMAAVAADVMLEWVKKPSWVGDEVLKTSAELLGGKSKGDLVDVVPDKYAPPPRRVTHVVLAGAATRMPAVLQLVETATGISPSLEVDPEDAVALGAAVHAGLLTGQLLGGVEMMDGGYVADQHGRATGLGTVE
ncbi:chaperone protein DnaK-like [Convolutriloba macropyga]|uniref:chaperone protein DnaK-like n=1 Tax=Convolutriloba macropyga TaxID=536237 RepID=UPI003F521AD9